MPYNVTALKPHARSRGQTDSDESEEWRRRLSRVEFLGSHPAQDRSMAVGDSAKEAIDQKTMRGR